MSDNTSAVAYLRNQGGTKSLAMNDLATDICLWSEKRGMTLVPRYLHGHLNVLEDHLSRRGQILKTEWSLNQTVADRIFRAWGRPFVDLFALLVGKNTKLAIYVSPFREEVSWKVDSLVQNWDGLYAYAYPPTSLIRPKKKIPVFGVTRPTLLKTCDWYLFFFFFYLKKKKFNI